MHLKRGALYTTIPDADKPLAALYPAAGQTHCQAFKSSLDLHTNLPQSSLCLTYRERATPKPVFTA